MKSSQDITISAVRDNLNCTPDLPVRARGLLNAFAAEGNTRLYTDTDLERLEIILS